MERAVSVPRWTVGGIEAIPLPSGARNSVAYTTSADGSIVVGQASYSGGALRALLWTHSSGVQDLGAPAGGAWSSGIAPSANGAVVAATAGFGTAGLAPIAGRRRAAGNPSATVLLVDSVFWRDPQTREPQRDGNWTVMPPRRFYRNTAGQIIRHIYLG